MDFFLCDFHLSKKLIFNTIFSAYYFLKLHLHHFSKIKSQKGSQNSRNQGFSYYFCMLIEGSGSIPLTGGSGSGRVDPDPDIDRNESTNVPISKLRIETKPKTCGSGGSTNLLEVLCLLFKFTLLIRSRTLSIKSIHKVNNLYI
jgi:hypothetical protein